MTNFHKVLLNTLLASVTTNFLWFALTFWVYLETRSVMATAIVGGSYMLFVAVFGIFFGTIVDHNKKKKVMLVASTLTLIMYLLAGFLYTLVEKESLADWTSLSFWIFGGLILAGGVVGNLRNIALSTTVTLLVSKDERDKANGLVGTVQGLSFVVTSVFSGLSIGTLGMGWTLVIALVLTLIVLLHLTFIAIPEKKIFHDPNLSKNKIDLKGSMAAIHAVPGLMALIFFATFNNFVGGVFMALMDPYGLTLFSVEVWGIVLGFTTSGFIIGGLIIAKKGLGKQPLRTLLLVNIIIAVVSILFTIREVWLLFAVGTFLYMCLIPIVEASEQTVIQRVVPFERQGRVFGFAQSVEAAASPLTAFLIGPIAQFWVIPYMRSEQGRSQFNLLLGQGEARGIALIFLIASIIMLAIACMALRSRSYRLLSAYYEKA